MKPTTPGRQAAFEAMRKDMGPLLKRFAKIPTGTGVEYTWEEINDPNLGHRDQIKGTTLLGSLVSTGPGEWNRFLDGRLEDHEKLNYRAVLRRYNLVLPISDEEKNVLRRSPFASLKDAENALSRVRPEAREVARSKITNWVNWRTNPFIESYMMRAAKKGKAYVLLCRLLRI